VTEARAEAKSLLSRRSVRVGGEITLASGRVSDFYVDTKQTSLCAKGAACLGMLLADLINNAAADAVVVAGPTLGADPLITATLLALLDKGRDLEGIIVRKEAKGHGTGAWLEGAAHVLPGSKIAVVEDVVTTGGSGLKAVQKLVDAGFIVENMFCVVDREEGGREAVENAGYQLHSIFTQSDLRS